MKSYRNSIHMVDYEGRRSGGLRKNVDHLAGVVYSKHGTRYSVFAYRPLWNAAAAARNRTRVLVLSGETTHCSIYVVYRQV